ncbi:bestrophin family protein [Pseudanabaena sp. 'Roaring Creek']|uniref:bestrophin family protein n=1 Tax=Pseudanabaena sp. 'Roaring Creek' TaxID=1681830 RepID=UPI0006D7FEEE|nr:bestrophin family ion channel [Pseudanabaena sp. 'Roaring Creek']
MTFQWFDLAFKVQGSVAPIILPRVLIFAGFALGISVFHYYEPQISLKVFGDMTNNVVFNLVLGLLLVFRTNTAYDRYWEGRKAWGTLVVNIRNLSRLMQISINSPQVEDQKDKEKSIQLLTAFAIATKLHLRNEEISTHLNQILTEDEVLKLNNVKHVPLELTLWLSSYLQKQMQSDRFDTNYFVTMNTQINALVEGLTSCERILKTPLPIAYRIYLKRLILIYCFGLPFHLVIDIHWLTAIAVGLVSFILLGVEQIGNEIENPFGHDFNDLPIDEICEGITNNVKQVISYQSI